MTYPHRTDGFTLVELMVTLAVAAILAAVAVPSFRDLMAKRQVESAAQAYVAALREAQASAVARNRNVEVIFTTSDPVPGSAAAAAAVTTATGKGWLVRERSSTDAQGFITGYAVNERLPKVTMQAGASASSVGFTPLGRAVDFSTGSRLPLDNNLVVKFTHAGSAHEYCAFMTTGGAVGVCNPTAVSGSSLACTPRLAAGAC